MKQVTLEELLEAGCHFGHQVTRQNPKARDYVFEARDNIHIIDLEKTKEGLDEAIAFVKSLAAKPESSIVILGTKRQAQEIVKTEAKRARDAGATGVFYVTNRWIGGTFTNLSEILKNFKRMDAIKTLQNNQFEREKYTKRELLLMEREYQKLESFYGGIVEMRQVPSAIFVIDTHMEHLAVHEARAMGVTTVGITDTNADPTLIDYAIPANDDAVGSIQLITASIVDAFLEGRKQAQKSESHEKPEQTAKNTKEELTKDSKTEEVTKNTKNLSEEKTSKNTGKTRKTKTTKSSTTKEQ